MSPSQPDGFLALPPAGTGSGVLVLHAWWGLNDTTKAVCTRLAGAGFVAFAPDLYHGKVAATIPEAEVLSKALDAKDLVSFKIAAGQYRDLLKNHIAKENNVLFVMADSLLDDDKQDDLAEKFETFEEGIIGHGVHEQLHGMIHQWEQKFGEG